VRVAEFVTVRGTAVPRIGLGTWDVEGDDCVEAVRHALQVGYRHLDTARMYGNERQVAEGLARSGVDREQVWLTSKIWRSEVEPTRLRRAAEDSLRALRTDYLDLLLLHWPVEDVPLGAQLEALTTLRDQGKIRQLGVSNYPAELLRRALELAPVFCDQVEYHPFLDQSELLGVAADRDLLLAAYSPMARGEVVRDPTLAEIGREYGKSAAQVALRWLLDQPQVCALPRSTSAENRAANLDVFDFELTAEERARITALRTRARRVVDPPFAPDWAA
jgi:2,5-diketo-D-gluconate reductase B